MLGKLTCSLLVSACLAGPVFAQSAPVLPTAPTVHGPALLVHGNYCGPGNNAPLAPIDALDAACARHDACTPEGSLPSKACNLRLEREAARISRDPRQPEDLRAMAGLISAGASLMLSDSGGRQGHALLPAGLNRAVASPEPLSTDLPADLLMDEGDSGDD